jgi:hypothetical protein
MNIFITLLDNVNKSRISAGNLFLRICHYQKKISEIICSGVLAAIVVFFSFIIKNTENSYKDEVLLFLTQLQQ